MQYQGAYPRNGHQAQQPHTSSHHSQQSPSNSNTHSSGYPPQQPHGLSGYQLSSLPNGIMAGNHSNTIPQPITLSNPSQHGTSPTDPRRPYYSPPTDQPNTYYTPLQHSALPGSQYAMTPHAHLDSQAVRAHAHTHQFTPTPSEIYSAYPNTPIPSQRVRPSVEPYYHMSPNPQHSSQHTSQRGSPPPASRSTHSAISPSTNAAFPGDRYPCDLCDRSFTRSHDRRRHHETVHATTPVLHRCSYCGKDFSRADSLKRHVDNGCDEMSRR